MSRRDYSEDRLVQEPAAAFLERQLNWRSIYAFDSETYGPDSLLGRKDRSEVVLTRELTAALKKLNPKLPDSAIDDAMEALLDADPTKSMLQHNEAKWKLMRDGVPVKIKSDNGESDERVRVIDFDTPDNNDFLAVRELWVKGTSWDRRCDIVGFVNGLPLVFIELKRHDKGLKAAFDDNYRDNKDTIPHLFHYNALVIVSNGVDARFGALGNGWDHFYRWKRLNEAGEDPAPKPDEPPKKPLLPILLEGMCSKNNLLDIVENFTLFDSSEGFAVKIVARNHQYLGVNLAIANLQSNTPDVAAGRLGVFWHTQGSGKSYSMVFFCQKIHRKVSASYTFVLMTDRKELDTQIYGTFVNCGAATNKGDKARNGDGLQRLLKDQDRRYVFSLIHKFHEQVKETWSLRDDIIVVSDEAHRTQYGRLALNMRKALQNAKFIGFTGTPLIDGPEKQVTREVFGDYVSVYDFQRAVADGATLPLFYENRGEKLQIVDVELNRRIEERIDAAKADGELDEEQEEKLYRQLARDYPVLTSDSHLGDIASDFVEHFHQRWRLMEALSKPGEAIRYGGNSKAMFVCIDKVTCVRMYALIKTRWAAQIVELEARLDDEQAQLVKTGIKPSPFVERLRAHIAWMRETQMCAVFSPEQNEVKDFEEWELDVRPHRELISKGIDGRSLEECFKDSRHPFRIAIVCAMWLTGFDVKSLATLYLDKPMKGHTLMQAIARVNRVAANKKNGLVIDYNGMLKSLRKALATFAQVDASGPAVDPLRDETQALEDYAEAILKARVHLMGVGYDLDKLIEADGFDKQLELLLAENAVCCDDESKKTYQVFCEDIADRFRGLFPNAGLFNYDDEENALTAIYNRLQIPSGKVDISGILQELHAVVDAAVAAKANPNAVHQKSKQYDLSGINFERLRAEFAKSPLKQKLALTLKEKIEARLASMIAKNPTRVDFHKRYLDIVADYNRDKDEVEIQRVFEELMRFHDSLDQEEQRYTREGLENEDQLAVFDLLSQNKLKLSKADREKIKNVSVALLAMLETRKQEMSNLRDRASAQAKLKVAIINELLTGMPDEFTQDEIIISAESVFRHVEFMGRVH